MIKLNKKLLLSSLITGVSVICISGCGFFGGNSNDGKEETTPIESVNAGTATETTVPQATEVSGLEKDRDIVVDKAKFFNIESFKDGYYIIDTQKDNFSQRVLVVPEGKEIPEGTGKDTIIVKQPVTTSRVDSISWIDLLERIQPEMVDKVTLVATKKEKMKIDRVSNNMDVGITEFSGTVQKPDVALIKSKNPGFYFAHPDLLDEDAYNLLKEEEIYPFISYYHKEEDPLGRLEWIKVLGAIFGDFDSAEAYYNDQKAVFESVDASKAQGKTFVMFYLDKEKDIVYVRRMADAIAVLGTAAGGKNMHSDSSRRGWEEIKTDDFITGYKDTDYMIYMSDHGDSIMSLTDLKNSNEKFGEFKAVKDNNVWRTSKDFQIMNNYGDLVKDLNSVFAGDTSAEQSENFVKLGE